MPIYCSECHFHTDHSVAMHALAMRIEDLEAQVSSIEWLDERVTALEARTDG